VSLRVATPGKDPYLAAWADLRLRGQIGWVAFPMALGAFLVLWLSHANTRVLAIPLGLPALLLFFRMILARCPHCRGMYRQKGRFEDPGACRQCGIPFGTPKARAGAYNMTPLHRD
jgi:hypothetical protein